jgi:hypothetical protein
MLMIPAFTAAAEAGVPGDGYQLGRGWTVPDTALTLGGYATGALSKENDAPWSIDASHLSTFLWWQGLERLHFFSELDLEDALQIRSDRITTDNAYLALERLYVDWSQSDQLNLRLGKFLTPIGRWNLIHADPLVWTTSRPLITQLTFPTNATGAMAYGTFTGIGEGLDYSIYGSVGAELRPNPQQDPFNEAYGVHLSYRAGPSLQLGLSLANFEQVNELGDRKNLIGLDFVWTRARYEVSAEAAYRLSSQGSDSDESGGFIQLVAPLTDKLYGIARYEYFDPSGPASGVSLWLGGVAYHWNRAVVFKAEFSKGVNNRIAAPEGFLSSVAVLF